VQVLLEKFQNIPSFAQSSEVSVDGGVQALLARVSACCSEDAQAFGGFPWQSLGESSPAMESLRPVVKRR